MTLIKQFFITLFAFCIAFFVIPALLVWLCYGLLALYTGQIFGW